MPQDRRSFIRGFGVTLGSLIVSGSLPGCGPKKDAGPRTDSEDTTEVDPPSNGRAFSAPEWGQLRQCWLSLKTLTSESIEFRDVQGQFMIEAEVHKRHHAVMDRLVAADQVEEPVARQMRIAFDGAFAHVVRSMATCYFAIPPEYGPREDLLQQADALRKVSGDVDPVTTAKAEAAIVQDIAFVELFDGNNGWVLMAGHNAGNLKASPETLEAARLLTQLFLETPD